MVYSSICMMPQLLHDLPAASPTHLPEAECKDRAEAGHQTAMRRMIGRQAGGGLLVSILL
eukprot:SAG22_NODE_910_length_6547_cov_2.044975_9_plen_60_part_00